MPLISRLFQTEMREKDKSSFKRNAPLKSIAVLLIAIALAALGGCSKLTLAWADMDADGAAAKPALFASEPPTLSAWQSARRPALQRAFEENVYGHLPDKSETRVVSRRVLDAAAYNGQARLEEYQLIGAATFGSAKRRTDAFFVDVLTPNNLDRPAPIILMETFCPRADTFPNLGVQKLPGDRTCNGDGFSSRLMHYVFGRYIATPPIEMILARGYGIAAIYPGEVVPDNKKEGLKKLEYLAAGHANADTRWGAVAAWAWTFSRVIDVLQKDDSIDQNGLILWGHSRYGKSALFAAAMDERVDGVIAHQSGTGGASLTRKKAGESLRAITSNYPHWFSRRYAGFSRRESELPVDQHELLSLIAPRPVLLGNARRDVWSDPAGAFRAEEGAAPAYRLYGINALEQDRLKPFRPDAYLSYWIRPGTHGVVKEDWPAFLAFLDAHFSAAE